MVPDRLPSCSGRLAGRPLQGLACLLQSAASDLAGVFGEFPGALVGFDQGQLLFHVFRMTGGYDSYPGAGVQPGSTSAPLVCALGATGSCWL